MILGIRSRMTFGIILIILLTVFVMEALIINIVRVNYYNNLEANLWNQLKVSSEMYSRYFSDASLAENVMNNVDTFWKQTSAQVQILDTDGRVLMDSIGYMPEEDVRMPDVEKALETGRGSWTGKVPYDSNGVMAVSAVLTADGETVGVLRFISSLRGVDEDVRSVSRIFIIIGAVVAVISILLSFLLSSTIVDPLKRVTDAAARMASGDINVRSTKTYNDEIGKLSDTLNYLADEIDKRDRMKNEFISSISHELRTPLTSIKGWAVTLKEVKDEDRELHETGLDIIENECDRLTAMVAELLDFSRLVSGRLTIKKESIQLEEFVDIVGRQLAPRAARDGLHFSVEVEGELPEIVTDGNRLKQVIINVLDNAFRFTPAGGSVLFKTVVSGGEVIFTVSDTGCGIPADELPYIKEKFFKGRNSKLGSGIGLSICDEIIGMMGGSLAIYSTENKGTKVVIRIPCVFEGGAA
ncbi:MAG TPA: HAMP domain-containing sensor histidine kinase [Clostridiales bacterium]|nr:HAMP domain-containing sensor histidine kinase [Clostridiales bacterium]